MGERKDNLTPEQRSHCMSRVKGVDTSLERRVRSELHKRGLRFRKHVKELPGKPDIVFTKAKVAVFIDGDFWHGYRFPTWEHKIADFWKQKIGKTRKRDQRNFKKLRSMGWKVIRIWQHEMKKNFEGCLTKIITAIRNPERKNPEPVSIHPA
jgi:DNA mismatch endonuclease (patch repair protein)